MERKNEEPYNHLCIEERRNVYFWRQQNISVTEIAKRLGRHRSTIFREIQRNTWG
ncbi:MAG: helix-turn-helix domain-containing protein [Saprospiraceae bacterium]|nr:helix-turn-helix domain-containing protein [Saprospiraceae bacterium]